MQATDQGQIEPIRWAARTNAVHVAETRKSKRPLLVWLISFSYAFVALEGLANAVLLATGAITVAEPHRSDFAHHGLLPWIPSIVGSLLMLVFSAALFQLRATAIRWCEVLLVLSLATTGIQLAIADITGVELDYMTLVSTFLSISLLVAVYIYGRGLRSRGVLL